MKKTKMMTAARLAFWLLLGLVIYLLELPAHMGLDSVVFHVMGQMLLNGTGDLYADLFDHKGPLVYVINLFYEMHPVMEYVILILFFMTVMECAWRVVSMMTSSTFGRVLTVCVSVIYFAGTLEPYSTEEMSLPFSFISLWLAVRAVTTRDCRLSMGESLVIGVCFALSALTRLNNCAPSAAVILFFISYGWWRNGLKNALRISMLFLAGALIILLPTVIYFGAKGTLGDMLYANVTFNIMYKMTWPHCVNHNINDWTVATIYRLPIWFCLIVGLLRWRRAVGWLAVCLSAMSLLAVGFQLGYYYYFMVLLPCMVLAYSILLYNITWRSITVALVLTAMQLFYPTLKAFAKYRIDPVMSQRKVEYHHAVEANKKLIDETISVSDRDSVFLYMPQNQAIQAILDLKITPYGKFFFLNDYLMAVDSRITDYQTEMFANRPPRWIVSADSIPFDGYTMAAEGDEMLIWRRNY